MFSLFSVNRCFLFIAFSFILSFSSCSESDSSPKIKQPEWKSLPSPVQTSLRGIAAVSDQICWASGANGTVLRTTDGGNSWQKSNLPNEDSVDFRDIHAVDSLNAMVLSAGSPAVVLKTKDGGQNWQLVYSGQEKELFYDAFDFWDTQRGIAFSDALTDRLVILTTKNGGDSWERLPDSLCPKVHPKQGGFAASGTCLKTLENGKVIIGLGGPKATVLISENFGQTWNLSTAPLDFDAPSKGVYSLDFINNLHGFCVGGDYRGDSLSTHSIAMTEDGGQNWTLVNDTAIAGKYRSCIAYIGSNKLIAVSRTGSNYSLDNGENWHSFTGELFSISVAQDGSVWGSGPKGTLARLEWK